MSEVFQFKRIEPKALNAEAIRRRLYSLVEAEGKVLEAKLRPTVKTWRHRPSFRSDVSISGGNLTVLTGPAGDPFAVQLFEWTDQGTRRHTITARRAPRLRFQTGYTPKTSPGQFSSGQSRTYGPWRSPVSVMHPGTTARGWTEELGKSRRSKFVKKAEDAVAAGADNLF